MAKEAPKRRSTDFADGVIVLRRRGWFSLLVAAACILLPVVFIGSEIKEFIAPSVDVYSDPSFENLTRDKLEWDVYYGKSPMCGNMECHLTADYPAERFTRKMVLPAREFPLNNYKPGQLIYMRTALRIPERFLQQEKPVALHSLYVWARKYEFFVNGVQTDEGEAETMNITIPRRIIGQDGVVQLALRIDPGNLPYQGLANRRDLLLGERSTLKATAFRPRELQTTYFLWFLLPRLTFCFIFAFLYLFLAQNRELFSFILYLFVSSVALLIESGYSDGLELWGVNRGILSPAIQSFTDPFLLLFIHDFFRKKTPGFFRWFRIALTAQAVIIALCWLLLPAKSTVNVIFVLIVVGRTAAVIYGLHASWTAIKLLKHSKKSPSRVVAAQILFVFFVVSLVPLFLENRRLIADILNLNISAFGFPWSAAFDLILFAVLASITAFDYGNTANARIRAEKDLKAMEERLELGRSVQNMLFPVERTGGCGVVDYQFFFESAQTMAGDWYYKWKCPDGSLRLFIGDVTGKGPQAALAVAAIISVLTKHRDAGDGIEETIRSLNLNLHKLFGGRVMSTMSVTVIEPGTAPSSDTRGGESVTLYNCGTPGWIVYSAEGHRGRYLPLPSQQIGTQEGVRIGKLTLALDGGDYLATSTDGCIDGSRAIKKFIDVLGRTRPEGTVHLFELMVEAGSQTVHPDDRTALILHRRGFDARKDACEITGQTA